MRFIRSHRTLLAGLLALGVAAVGQAQQPQQQTVPGAVISGRVTSDQGAPLLGANIFIQELAISVATNEQGRYSIAIPPARVSGQSVVLRARSVGFQPQTRAITLTTGAQTADFELKADVNRLSEIVVTGTVGEGTERAKVPFSIARLTVEDLPVPSMNPMTALSGKVAGLRVASVGGRPGSEPEIMMRGPTSINGTGRDRSPLIIVDGVIMNVGSLTELGGLDIESVEVVKGAAGASLYGTRAANGVITITTKRGLTGQDAVKFSVRSEYGVSDLNSIEFGMPINHPLQLDETGTRFCVQGSGNVSSCSRTVNWMEEILRINSVNADTTRTQQNIQWNNPTASSGDLQNVYQSQIWPTRYYNSLAQLLKRNPTSLTSIDATGKMGAARFFVSGSYQNEKGAIRGLTGNQQRRGRVNLDYDARSDLNLQVSMMYDHGTNDNRTANGIFGSVLRGLTPGTDLLARDTLGRAIIRSGGTGFRPTGNGGGAFLYDLENGVDTRSIDRFLGSISGKYTPKEWVTVQADFAYDNRDRLDDFFHVKGYRTNGINTAENNGRIIIESRGANAMNTSLTATFRRQLTSELAGRLQFRGLYDANEFTEVNSRGEVFSVKDVFTTTNTSTNKNATSTSESVRNAGAFAGFNLDYKDRYTVDGTIRRDGSSLFGPSNRWATYGSIRGVWQVSRESFWKVDWMTDFRIRAARGSAGSPPRFNAQYETYRITTSGPQLGQAGNSELKPEVTTETEIGTEFTLLNRLGMEVNYVLGNTKDQILLVNTPNSLGFSQQWQNAATLQNKTWEVAASLPVVNTRNFNWSMRGTWDRTRTFISELFVPEFTLDGGTGQGTGSFFRVTADRGKSNGFQMNRFGNVWGRRFYRGCGSMPQSLQAACGPNKDFQVNDQGYVVWVGAGYSWREGITKNLWQTALEAKDSPWNYKLYWGMPIIDRPLRGEPGEGNGITQVIGNSLPDWRFSYGNTASYKRLSLYALVEGTIGHDINNQGEGWGLLDISSANFDQNGKSVELAKPVGYSWRAGGPESTGIGGFYDVLGPNNYTMESGSFAKLREVTLSYHVGALRGWGDWTVGAIGRNLYTWTKYTGLDPEIGATAGSATQGTGSGIINQTDAFGFPTLRTFTFSLSTRF
jgi:TonB-linked SusC/RagA family outer membrane protein